MYELMVNYVGRNGLISSFQYGLGPGHSKATTIARFSDDIRLNMESNQPTILVLLAFQRPLTVCAIDCSFLSCALVPSHLFPWYQKVAYVNDVSPLVILFFSVY
jgi:hypothetical protein